MDVNVDLINDGKAQGQFANQLMTNGTLNVGAMRPYVSEANGNTYITVYTGGDKSKPVNYKKIQVNTNGTLRRDEWKTLDAAILGISETRLNGVADLMAKGLVFNLGNAMGTTVLETHDVGDALEAELTMDGISRGQNDRLEYGTNYLPIPIIHADYEINSRVLAASRALGNALDTGMAERAARKVTEKLENMLFTSTSYSFGSGTIYGYLNHPDRNQETLSLAWDDASKTGLLILDDVRAMKQASIDAKHYGPWVLYIPTSYETVLDKDYAAAKGSNTIRERILKIAGISDIKVVDTLTDDNVVLVQMTSDVVRLVKGMPIQTVQWKTEGNFINKYKVMTIQVPQVRSDQDGNSGIVHLA